MNFGAPYSYAERHTNLVVLRNAGRKVLVLGARLQLFFRTFLLSQRPPARFNGREWGLHLYESL
jgi:hypothetical protein